MTHFVRTAAAAVLLAAPLLGAAAVPGFRSTGTIAAQVNLQGTMLNVDGNVQLYHKGAMYRLDLVSLGLPGGTGSTMLAQSLIGPGGVSFVYDGARGTMTAWSTSNRTYYQADRALPSGGAAAANAAVQSAPAGNGDPLSALASLASSLRDVQTATIQLVGHSTVNGHPATDLDVQMKRQQPGKPPEDYHARLALADDLGDFPLQIQLQSTPSSASAFGGTMKIDLTSVQPDTPADGMFAIPQGYQRVSSLSGVVRMGF